MERRKKIVVKKKFGKKKLGKQKIVVKTKFWSERKNDGPKKIFGLKKKFWSEKILA